MSLCLLQRRLWTRCSQPGSGRHVGSSGSASKTILRRLVAQDSVTRSSQVNEFYRAKAAELHLQLLSFENALVCMRPLMKGSPTALLIVPYSLRTGSGRHPPQTWKATMKDSVRNLQTHSFFGAHSFSRRFRSCVDVSRTVAEDLRGDVRAEVIVCCTASMSAASPV